MTRSTLRAIILSRSHSGEADCFFDVYSCERGKVRVRARGVRKTSSRLAPFLQPFRPLLLEVVEQHSFPIVVGAEDDGPFLFSDEWGADVVNIAYGQAALEFFSEMIKRPEADERLYDWLLSFIQLSAAVHSERPEDHVRFQLLLLTFFGGLCSLLGIGFALGACVLCGKEFDGASQVFCSVSLAGLVCPSCDVLDKVQVSSNDRKLLRVFFEGNVGVAAKLHADFPWEKTQRIMDSYLRYVSESPLTALAQYYEYVGRL